MGAVPIDHLETGMVLSEDVRDITSRLLLSKGVRIQPEHIRILKIWGVTEVPIKGARDEKEPPEAPIDPEQLKIIQEETRQRFRHHQMEHPVIKELFRQAVFFQMQSGSSGRAAAAHHDGGSSLKSIIRCDFKAKIDGSEMKLPAMPAIISELNDVTSTPFASAGDIAKIVNKSPSLTSLLLKIVNSALYGFPSRIDSIARAVTMIGLKEIQGLAIGLTAIKMFRDIPKQLVDMKSFIRHSLACGITSRILAAQNNLKQTEQMFVAGLLHDIGRMVIYKYFPEEAKSLLYIAGTLNEPLCRIEKKAMGCRHTDIARQLFAQWKLPLQLQNNIFHHHNPSSAMDVRQAAVVHLADIMVNSLGLGTSGEKLVPPFDVDAWDRLNVPPAVFGQVIRQTVHQLGHLERFLASEG